MTERIVLVLAYDGSGYSGFVRQNNGVTVGGLLEQALRVIDPNVGPLTCSSRTDAGVHARHQIVSFLTEKSLRSRGWVLALGQNLPDTISVVGAASVPEDFDPRRDPLWKQYRYRVLSSPVRDPFLERQAFRVVQPLDLELMRREAQDLVGEHDFSAFRAASDERPSAVRTIHELRIEQRTDDRRVLEIVVRGNRFLYNMVRIIAGTLVDVGRGKLPAGACRLALETANRADLGMTAPAFGLCLEHVELQSTLLDPWPLDAFSQR